MIDAISRGVVLPSPYLGWSAGALGGGGRKTFLYSTVCVRPAAPSVRLMCSSPRRSIAMLVAVLSLRITISVSASFRVRVRGVSNWLSTPEPSTWLSCFSTSFSAERRVSLAELLRRIQQNAQLDGGSRLHGHVGLEATPSRRSSGFGQRRPLARDAPGQWPRFRHPVARPHGRPVPMPAALPRRPQSSTKPAGSWR